MGEVHGPRHARGVPRDPRVDPARLEDLYLAFAAARPHLGQCPIFVELVMEAVATRLMMMGSAMDVPAPARPGKRAGARWSDVIDQPDFLARHSTAAGVDEDAGSIRPPRPAPEQAHPPLGGGVQIVVQRRRDLVATARPAEPPRRLADTDELDLDTLSQLLEQRLRTQGKLRGRRHRQPSITG